MLRTLLIMLAITTICTSCQRGEMEGVEQAQPATIRLEVRGEEEVDVATRTVNEDVINDMHVLIYNNAGELIGQKYQSGGETVTVDTRSATGCNIYVIANTGNANLFKGYDIHQETTLENMVKTVPNANTLNKGTNLPMTGSRKNVNISAGANSLGTLTVTRIVAKITLNIKVKEHSGIVISNYTLCNVPLSSYYIARPLSTESSTTDTAAGNDAAKKWENAITVMTDGATSVTGIFYMFENRRGVKTITQQKDKNMTTAPAHATYVHIYGTVNGVAVVWKVFLGANNTTNFNIKRNRKYTYNITLNDIALTDTRIDIDFTNVIDLSVTGTANCYLAAKTSTWYKFKATVRGNGAATAALISPTGSNLAANAPINPTAAELIWEAGHGAYDIKAKELIQVVFLQNGYIYFKTGHLDEGNAVIAAKDAGGTIIWSWHIWKTHFDLNNMPRETYQTCTYRPSWSNIRLINDRTLVMMDRNMGAANNNTNDVSAFGVYFQFGRKDPIVGPVDLVFSGLTKTYPANKITILSNAANADVKASLKYSIEHPNVRICTTGNGDGNNWMYGAAAGTAMCNKSSTLWGDPPPPDNIYPTYSDGMKTIYDPCPAGWKVPPQDTYTRMVVPTATGLGFEYLVTNTALWNADMNNIVGSNILDKCTTINGIRLKFLANGGSTYIPKHGTIPNHVLVYNPKNGNSFNLWTAAPFGIGEGSTNACISFNNSASNPSYICTISSGGRHAAMPIRCVKEDSYQRR